MKKLILLAVFSLIVARLCFSQSLGITGDSVSVGDDTVSFNQLISFSIPVKNTGNATFNGTFHISYTVNDSFQVDTDTTFAQLSVGESTTISEIELIDPVQYSIGDNIVVIWPDAISPPVPTTDSAFIHIWVDSALSVGSPSLKNKIKAWYNPFSGKVQIIYSDLKSEVVSISIYDIAGKSVLQFKEAKTQIPLHGFPSQVYLLTIRTRDGETVTFKIPRF